MEKSGALRNRHRMLWRVVDVLAVLALVTYLWVLIDWWTATLGNISPASRALILLCCAGIAIVSGIAWTIRAILATRSGPMPRHLLARPVVVVIIGAFALSPISTPGFDHSRPELDEVAAQIHRDGPNKIDYSETARGARRIGSEEITSITRPRDDEVYFSTTRGHYAWHYRGWVHSEGGPPEALTSMFEGYEIEELGAGWYRYHGWL